jgi:hypothetical protein
MVWFISLQRGQWHSTPIDYSLQTQLVAFTVAANRVLVSYGGQPVACYGCNNVGYIYQSCLLRRRLKMTTAISTVKACLDTAGRGQDI